LLPYFEGDRSSFLICVVGISVLGHFDVGDGFFFVWGGFGENWFVYCGGVEFKIVEDGAAGGE
jgi:hypothetical protein